MTVMQNVCSHQVACHNRTEREKMNKLWKRVILCTSCLCFAATDSALADYIGLVHVTKGDEDTVNLCNNAMGDNVPEQLDVCNVLAQFDNPEDRLLSAGNGDIAASNAAFYQHPFNSVVIAPSCTFVGLFPDLICDSFITIGWKCSPDPTPEDPTPDATAACGDWNPGEFQLNGHIVGGWFNADPTNGQGDAGTWPNLQVLFLQSSVAQGLSLSGDIDIFWLDDYTGEVFAAQDLPIECAATCGSCPTDTDGDGDTDAADLAVLLGSWGPCGPGVPCECLDNDSSGSIDAFDLAVLLGAWGPCL